MALAIGSVFPAFADGAKITIDGAGNQYQAFRVLNLTTSLKADDAHGAGEKHNSDCYNYSYTVNEKYRAALQAALAGTGADKDDNGLSDQEILDYLNGLSGEDHAAAVRAFADKMWSQIRTLEADAISTDKAFSDMSQGYYLIALMKKGTWTGGGHFVVVWWADDKIRINDPASTRDKRLNGDPATFRNEAAYYWVVDAREYNNGTIKQEDEDMDQEKFNKMFATAMQQYRQELRDNDSGEWSRAARQFAIDQGIFAGSGTVPDGTPNFMWEDFLTREQCAQVLYRFAQKYGLE